MEAGSTWPTTAPVRGDMRQGTSQGSGSVLAFLRTAGAPEIAETPDPRGVRTGLRYVLPYRQLGQIVTFIHNFDSLIAEGNTMLKCLRPRAHAPVYRNRRPPRPKEEQGSWVDAFIVLLVIAIILAAIFLRADTGEEVPDRTEPVDEGAYLYDFNFRPVSGIDGDRGASQLLMEIGGGD